jgi:cob(I)alamin adenosyltransferase
MVKLNKIYTRSGDKGTTVLASGDRVAKHALRIAAYGTVDETNAMIGLARLRADGPLDERLARIQNDCFDLGADLATPETDEETGEDPGYEPLRIVQAQVDRLEAEIDEMNEVIAPLTSFILPAGSEASAHLHAARTVARRAERIVSELMETEPVSEAAFKYLNRLSDFLFVAARHANADGADDVLWVPGDNR